MVLNSLGLGHLFSPYDYWHQLLPFASSLSLLGLFLDRLVVTESMLAGIEGRLLCAD
jgi:hypothetical protein